VLQILAVRLDQSIYPVVNFRSGMHNEDTARIYLCRSACWNIMRSPPFLMRPTSCMQTDSDRLSGSRRQISPRIDGKRSFITGTRLARLCLLFGKYLMYYVFSRETNFLINLVHRHYYYNYVETKWRGWIGLSGDNRRLSGNPQHPSCHCTLITPIINPSLKTARSMTDALPYYIYKLVPSTSPVREPIPERLPVSELDQRSGFIHLSTAVQVRNTLKRFFKDEPIVYVLRIECQNVERDVRWESPDGNVCGPRPGEGLFPVSYLSCTTLALLPGVTDGEPVAPVQRAQAGTRRGRESGRVEERR
jgi:uncharacterized protein (DUF952 family)